MRGGGDDDRQADRRQLPRGGQADGGVRVREIAGLPVGAGDFGQGGLVGQA